VKDALQTLAWRFNANRMVMDYARKFYLPCIGGVAYDVDGR
jgi:starch phosphorylase